MVCDFHNDLIFPLPQGGFFCAWDDEGRVCIVSTSPKKYMPKHMNTTRNIKKIACGCETCIGKMLLQYDLNKWWLR